LKVEGSNSGFISPPLIPRFESLATRKRGRTQVEQNTFNARFEAGKWCEHVLGENKSRIPVPLENIKGRFRDEAALYSKLNMHLAIADTQLYCLNQLISA
jgi:hypothetical protein